jgi:hypothetical protein
MHASSTWWMRQVSRVWRRPNGRPGLAINIVGQQVASGTPAVQVAESSTESLSCINGWNPVTDKERKGKVNWEM